MEDVGHSPLLKFIVADTKIRTMSEPTINWQVSFDNSNITSTVPREQRFRDAASESNTLKEPSKYPTNDATAFVDDVFENEAKYPETKDHKEKMAENEADCKDNVEVQFSKEDYVLTPVMTVTKEEAVLTKGNMKLQRVSVSEDISDEPTTTLEPENVSVTADGDTGKRTEVIGVQQIRKETLSNGKEPTEAKKPKTRIPTLRFRQAVDQLKQDRKNFEDRKEPETPQVTSRRSSIPRLKDSKSPALGVKDSTPQKIETIDTKPRLSDEFDKLYDEMAEGQDSLDNLSLSSKIEDPVKVDNTFEEIIHAYEENEIQPINVEKVRQSKIPLLKRKSEHEIDVPKQNIPVIRQSVSVDLSKIKNSETITENHSKIQSITLNKCPIRTGLISKKISDMKSAHETSSLTTVNAATIADIQITENTESKITKNEVSQESLNKTSPANDIQENISTDKVSTSNLNPTKIINEDVKHKMKHDSNKIMTCEIKPEAKLFEEQNIFTQNEESQIKSETHGTEEIHNEHLKHINTKKHVETSLNTEIIPENKNEEDIPTIRGKVNRIIKRMDSKETDINQPKKDLKIEAPKQKSVLSKIAIFEHAKPADFPNENNLLNPQTSNIKPVEPTEANELLNERPKIVEEVLKSLPIRYLNENNVENYAINQPEISCNTSLTKIEPSDNERKSLLEAVDIEPQETHVSIKPIEIKVEENNKIQINVQPKIPIIDASEVDQFIPAENELKFDIQITDVKPEVNLQSNKEQEGEHIKSELEKLENKDLDSTNSQKILENISSSPGVLYGKQDYIDNNQNSISNLNYSQNGFQEEDSRKTCIVTNTNWKTEPNISNDNVNSNEYYENVIKQEPVVANSRPEIISNIAKQEIKFKHLKVDNQGKVKENETLHRKSREDEGQLRIHSYRNNEMNSREKSKSLAELDLGDAVKGRVKNIIVRMKSLDRLDEGKKEVIDIKERPRKRSVSEKIALFERKLAPVKSDKNDSPKTVPKEVSPKYSLSEEEYARKIEELSLAKAKYGSLDPGKMKYVELRDGEKMPAIGLGTALLDPKLTRYIVQAAIDLGYRTIDTAYIYGNEKEVGEAINEKIKDGTVMRSELFIISKLWSTFHRQDLVQRACRASLDAMGLDYFDLYLIHNPMSFKEGGSPVPKIANVLQFSEHDYMDAWFGMETLVRNGLVKRVGVSNFNSVQVDRVVEKGKIKPVVNQVECHPYLSQHRLDDFCQERKVKLCCYGVLGSKGTPQECKSALPPAIDDPLVRVMAAGLDVSPAALLISYQLELGRGVVTKASSAAHLWDSLQALTFSPSPADVSALHALNRNKRTFTFKGMGDTHRNYPFNIPY